MQLICVPPSPTPDAFRLHDHNRFEVVVKIREAKFIANPAAHGVLQNYSVPGWYVRSRSKRVPWLQYGVLLCRKERRMQSVSAGLHSGSEWSRELRSVPGRYVRAQSKRVPRLHCGALLSGSDR